MTSIAANSVTGGIVTLVWAQRPDHEWLTCSCSFPDSNVKDIVVLFLFFIIPY